MLYFKAKKNFPFGNDISIFIEIKSSSYNFINHEWQLLVHYYLNENDLIMNKVRYEISKYIIENGTTISEEQVAYLIENYIDKQEIDPIYSKVIPLFIAPTEMKDNSLSGLSTPEDSNDFVLNVIYSNPSLLEILPGSLKIYDKKDFLKKIISLKEEAIEITKNIRKI